MATAAAQPDARVAMTVQAIVSIAVAFLSAQATVVAFLVRALRRENDRSIDELRLLRKEFSDHTARTAEQRVKIESYLAAVRAKQDSAESRLDGIEQDISKVKAAIK